MKEEQHRFLSICDRIPARLTAEQAGWFLGFSPIEITVLMGVNLLKPLGHPARNGVKFFAAAELEELRRDVKWLAKASDAIVSHWKSKNTHKLPAGQFERSDPGVT